MPKWTHSTLGNVLSVIRGVTYKKEQARTEPGEGYLPVLRATNIQERLKFDELVYVPDSNVSSEQLLRKNDIVIAASSGSRSVVGKAAQLTENWKGSFGAFCFGLRPADTVNPRFVAWFLQTSEYRNRVSELAAGVNINNLRAQHIEQTPIRLPTLDEQQRIVGEIEKQFTRLDAGVASLKSVQLSLRRYRGSVLKAACEGKLVSRAEPLPPEALPTGWRWATLKELKTRSLYGPRFSSADYSESGYFVLRTSDISDGGKVDTASAPRLPLMKEEAAKYRVERGDLLITRTGSLGTLAIFDDDVDAIPGAYLIHYRLNTPSITGKYIFYFLKSPNGQRSLLKGGAGVGRPNLNAPTIEAIPIPLPPLDEQKQIVRELERELSIVEGLEAEIETSLRDTVRLRQSILSRAFTGKLSI